MSNTKQQTEVKQIKKYLELPHRETVISTNTIQTKPFDNQKINMSNNKQSSVEWYIIERHNIEIQSRLGKISSTQYDEQLIKIEEQAKAMHKSEIVWAHGIKMKGVNNHKCVSGEQYYNETFGDNNEKL